MPFSGPSITHPPESALACEARAMERLVPVHHRAEGSASVPYVFRPDPPHLGDVHPVLEVIVEVAVLGGDFVAPSRRSHSLRGLPHRVGRNPGKRRRLDVNVVT